MKDFNTVVSESTCQKRITICELYDINGVLLSRESNRCEPDGGVCTRLDVIQNKENYDRDSNCNWTHAEIRAISALPTGSKPVLSILYGHEFYCNNCETELKKVGIIKLAINHDSNPNKW